MAITITYTYKPDGVAANAFSVKFGDLRDTPVADYGLRRTDTNEELVAVGTDLDNPSAGVYTYELADPPEGVQYEYYISIEGEEGDELIVIHDFEGEASGGGGGGIGGPSGTESTLSITRADIKRALGRYLAYSRNSSDWSATMLADVNDMIKSGERQFYSPPPLPNERTSHVWSFLQPQLETTVNAPYSTGTIEIVDGEVTLTGGTWPDWAADGWLVVDGVGYEVDSRDSSTELTLVDTSVDVDALTDYSLERWRYSLPADFSAFTDSRLSFSPNDDEWFPVRQVSVSRIHEQRQNSDVCLHHQPTEYAIEILASNRTDGQRFQMLLWPSPSVSGTLLGRYYSNPSAISDAAPYPLGGQPHGETLLAACLAAAELEMNDAREIHRAQFYERLAASVALDRQLNTPRFFGSMNDAGRGNHYDRHAKRYVTYNNVLPGS